MNIKKITMFLFFFLLLYGLWAQPFPHHQNYGRRKRMVPNEKVEDRKLILFGVRTSRIKGDFIIVDFKFNKQIDPQAIVSENIIIDGKAFFKETLRFSKDGRSFRIAVKNPQEKFSIIIQGIKSMDGEILPKILLEDAKPESVYNFRRKEWQKYSSSKTI